MNGNLYKIIDKFISLLFDELKFDCNVEIKKLINSFIFIICTDAVSFEHVMILSLAHFLNITLRIHIDLNYNNLKLFQLNLANRFPISIFNFLRGSLKKPNNITNNIKNIHLGMFSSRFIQSIMKPTFTCPGVNNNEFLQFLQKKRSTYFTPEQNKCFIIVSMLLDETKISSGFEIDATNVTIHGLMTGPVTPMNFNVDGIGKNSLICGATPILAVDLLGGSKAILGYYNNNTSYPKAEIISMFMTTWQNSSSCEACIINKLECSYIKNPPSLLNRNFSSCSNCKANNCKCISLLSSFVSDAGNSNLTALSDLKEQKNLVFFIDILHSFKSLRNSFKNYNIFINGKH